MLKLERASREGAIHVIVRDKESLFTRPFVFAFTLALAIHLSLILLFHVNPFNIGISDTVFPPTRVEADAAIKESAIADVELPNLTIRGLPPVPSLTPILFEHPAFLTVRPIEYIKAESSTFGTFSQLESKIYQPEFFPSLNASSLPLKIVISGPLGDQSLLFDGIGHKTIPNFSEGNDKRMAYSVMVEGKTGKIFWFEPKQAVHQPPLDKFAESVLREMKFSTALQRIVLNGEIEFHFHKGKK